MRYQSIRAAIESRFEDHFIPRIGCLRTPFEVDFNGFDPSCKCGQKCFYLFLGKPVHQALLWTEQHIFVFQKKRRARQQPQLAGRNGSQKRVGATMSASQCSRYHRGIQNDSHNDII